MGRHAEPACFDGRYWMSYIGGALQGYENRSTFDGMALDETPERAEDWTR